MLESIYLSRLQPLSLGLLLSNASRPPRAFATMIHQEKSRKHSAESLRQLANRQEGRDSGLRGKTVLALSHRRQFWGTTSTLDSNKCGGVKIAERDVKVKHYLMEYWNNRRNVRCVKRGGEKQNTGDRSQNTEVRIQKKGVRIRPLDKIWMTKFVRESRLHSRNTPSISSPSLPARPEKAQRPPPVPSHAAGRSQLQRTDPMR